MDAGLFYIQNVEHKGIEYTETRAGMEFQQLSKNAVFATGKMPLLGRGR